jgi:hypothetical protein
MSDKWYARDFDDGDALSLSIAYVPFCFCIASELKRRFWVSSHTTRSREDDFPY